MTPTNRESSAAPLSTRMPLVRGGQRAVALGVLAALAVACTADGAAGPRAAAAPARDLQLGSVASVWNVQLRTLPPNPVRPGDPYYGYGHLQLRAGSVVGDACLPPNPVTPQPGATVLSVCGRIFDEGGAAYRGGGIYTANLFSDGTVLVAAFNGAVPNDPCRRYDVAGAVLVPDAIAADMIANPTLYQVRMFGDVAGATTRIGGLLDGSAWGSVGRAETDPFFAAKICSVAVTP
jgi:hypothetical protein